MIWEYVAAAGSGAFLIVLGLVLGILLTGGIQIDIDDDDKLN